MVYPCHGEPYKELFCLALEAARGFFGGKGFHLRACCRHGNYQAVAALPKDISTAIHLYYYENLPVKDISEATGKSESAVKALLFRGRKLLKLELESETEKG